jgi:hypothetical protein
MPPEVRYVKCRDGHIAYETSGAGELELVVAPGPASHLEVLREGREAEQLKTSRPLSMPSASSVQRCLV